jgi:CRISPR-associated protein Cas2
MLIVVAYDVPSDRRRVKLAHALKDFGQRVQYSVFECHLDTEQLGRLRTRLTPLLEPEEDQVRLYILCGECTLRMEVHGWGGRTEDPDVYVL